MRTSWAMRATSVAAGATTIDAPDWFATSAHTCARASAVGPRASGYALKFTTIAGVRTAPPGAEPPPRYKNPVGSRRRGWSILLVLLPSTSPQDEENQATEHRHDDEHE